MKTQPFDSQAYQLMKAVMNGTPEEVDAELAKKPNLDWQDSEDMSSLHHAAKRNRPDIIKKLVDAGASVHLIDKLQRTPLGIAAENGFIEAAKEIMAGGASPVNDPNENALNLAAENRQYEMAKLLLAAKFPVDFMPTASPSALMLAAQNNDIPMLEILVDAKADLNLRDMRNSTALHRTAWKNAYEAASYLIRQGADERLINIDGVMPERIAEEKGFTGLEHLFQQAGELREAETERREKERLDAIAAWKQSRQEIIDVVGHGSGRETVAPAKAQFKSRKLTR